MIATCTVKWFNRDKGYGFALTEDGTEIFVHATRVPQGKHEDLGPGAVLTVELLKKPDGLWQASTVIDVQSTNKAKRCREAILAAAATEPVEAIAAGLRKAADICARVGQIDAGSTGFGASERRSSGV